ncbi:protein of unknown function DUF849 [Actinokineospora spheciospongiae]|uniref:3-keto-5-aminohexanoate cleavage enzyme n=1 Tax=Actinokineospora spheciospongiae TaxID=909613 RepID=W7J8S6_9PSEU|nr:3-keto-5-aminohexanoate cleavage protein [Actinokineospora spheciospongiae]EWC62434.1 protein of unknown function DUF849 [Actinokineospora spheciospongiae]
MDTGVKRLKVCLNGERRRDEHPAVPVTAAEVGAAAVEAVAAGAEAVHVHPRDAGGVESLAAEDIGAGVRAARGAGVAVGVSTGLWITGGDVARRRAAVRGWADLAAEQRPDFASVNAAEPGFADLVGVLRDAGIGVEAGVWSVRDAEVVGRRPFTRVLVEITGGADPVGQADAVLARLAGLGVRGPRLLHGEGAACWPLVAHAGRLGLPTRIGLEDTLLGPGGEPVSGNAELVRLALGVWAGGPAGAGPPG